MKDVRELSDKELELEVKNYREKYFLDPHGSNAEYFANAVGKTMTNLIKWYTGTELNHKFKEIKKVKSINSIRDKSTSDEELKNLAQLSTMEEVQLNPIDIYDSIDNLDLLIKDEMKFNHSNIGQMHPFGNIPSYLGGITGKFLNENLIAQQVSARATKLENQIVAWINNEIGYDSDTSGLGAFHASKELKKSIYKDKSGGNMTMGGTTANIAAALIARNKHLPKIKKRGSYEGLEKTVILGNERSHYSLKKIAGMIGIGEENYVEVNTKNHKMDLKDLDRKLNLYSENGYKILGVFGNAGTTETGNIDDLSEIGKKLKEFEREKGYKPHFHVDAAHGGGFIFHPSFNSKDGKLKGINEADTITMDPHKMLYVHYNAGMLLVKNKKDMDLLNQEAGYLFKEDEIFNSGENKIEGSMSVEGVYQTWNSLNTIRKRGYQVFQEQNLRLAEYFKNNIEKKGFEVENELDTNIICFRYNNNIPIEDINYINKNAQKNLLDSGKAYISNDEFKRKKSDGNAEKIDVFRTVIINPYITRENIDHIIEEVKFNVEKVKHELKDKYHKIALNI
ncbi:hypothetical protein K9L97_05740 [Candidatus Woesearchaeota archaeon]|nr:hypothetical protein [Candidatus Woesearchaeota archaeon]